jgi:predicted nucleic acid-binding protein
MFNRPFDNQGQIRIRLETEAKLYIQDQIKNNILELVWSYILDFENYQNPHSERRRAIAKWRHLAIIDVIETPNVLANAKKLLSFGIKTKDALHVASAIEGKADYFLTTDDKLLSGIKRSNIIKALGPIDYIKVLEK